MAVEDCVLELFCNLGAAGVEAVKSVLRAQIAVAEAQLAVVRAQILQYDVLLVPVTATQQIAETILGQVEGYAALIPSELAAECVGLGEVNLDLVRLVEPITDKVRSKLAQLQRLLSFRDELEDLERLLVDTVRTFTDIVEAIEACP